MRKMMAYILCMLAMGAIAGACRRAPAQPAQALPRLSDAQVQEVLRPGADSGRYEAHLEEMPSAGAQRLRVEGVEGTLRSAFRDSNYLHVAAAQAVGITPVSDAAGAWASGTGLVPIRSCQDYYVDQMHFSLPYLTPGAKDLLGRLGRSFRDTLAARGGGSYRLKVTSALRTEPMVRRLRRRNGNAVDSSAHRYGTTFDISYSNFICDSVTPAVRTQEDLKNLLGEIVQAARERGELLAVYERHQACFHITSRK